MAAIKPKQRISTSEKLKREDWKRDTVLYYASACSNFAIDPSRAESLYKAANGELDESTYFYITQPFKSTGREDLQGYPSRIRNIDIIKSNVNLFMGEKSERSPDFEVIVKNSDYPTKLKEAEHAIILQNLQKEFLNNLINAGAYDGQQQPPDSPEVIKRKLSNISDEKAIFGQDFLDYTFFYNEIIRYWRKGFYDWIVTGRVFSFKDVLNEDLQYEIVSPIEISYMKSSDTDFLEDCEAVKRSKRYSVNECIDKFSGFEDFTETMMKNLESGGYGDSYGNSSSVFSIGYHTEQLSRNLGRSSGGESTNNPNVLVEHIIFTTQVKVGKRTNEDGAWDIVSEEYVPTKDEDVEWRWVSEKWQAYIINGKDVIGVEPLPLTRASLNNPTKSKGLYNGRLMHCRYTDPLSIVDIGIPYQIKYNIVHYQLEKIMAKNKDKMIIMPLGVIPEKEGHDMFSMMYYADATSYLFVDETKQSARDAMQHIRVLDTSLNQYIIAMYDILTRIKNDWDEAIGINPQRKGEVKTSAGKFTTEAAIGRGLLVSEELFAQYEEFEEREAQAFLDFAKYCCINGKKGAFISSDYKKKYLDIEPDSISEVEFGIFTKRSKEEKEKLQIMRNQAQAFIQNGMSPSSLVSILEANNISKLKEDLQNLEQELEQKQAAMAQAQEAAADKVFEQKMTEQKNELDVKYFEINKTNETLRANKLDDIESRLISVEKKGEVKLDVAKIEELTHERQKSDFEQSAATEELRLKEKKINNDAIIENKKAEAMAVSAEKNKGEKA